VIKWGQKHWPARIFEKNGPALRSLLWILITDFWVARSASTWTPHLSSISRFLTASAGLLGERPKPRRAIMIVVRGSSRELGTEPKQVSGDRRMASFGEWGLHFFDKKSLQAVAHNDNNRVWPLLNISFLHP
jgi:hypothetical protein